MLVRSTGRVLSRARLVSTLTSLETAALSKDFKGIEQSLFQLKKADLQPQNAHGVLVQSHATLLSHFREQKSVGALEQMLKIEKRLFELDVVRYSTCVSFLRLALQLNEPEKGVEYWVSYLEALGRRTRKPISDIISKGNHLDCSLLALACYFKACEKEKIPINTAAASSIVPLKMIPAIVGDVKLPASDLKVLKNGLAYLRSHREDFGSEDYVNMLRHATFEEVRVLFNEAMEQKDIPESVWAEFIRRFAETRQSDRAMATWNQMVQAGIKPTVLSWNSLLRAVSMLPADALQTMLAIWDKMIKAGTKPNAQSYGIRIESLHRNGRFDDALSLFENIRKSDLENVDIFVVNNMLNGLVDQKLFDSSLSLLNWAQKNGINANIVSYNTLLRSAIDANESEVAQKVLSAMFDAQVRPDIVTYSHFLHSQFKTAIRRRMDVSDQIDSIIKEMENFDIKPNAQFLTILADGISKTTRDVHSTRKIFETITNTNFRLNVATFGAFIDGEIRNGDMNHAVKYFNIMENYGLAPNVPTYTQIIDGALKKNRPEIALRFWDKLCHSKSARVSPTVWTYMFVLGAANEANLRSPAYKELLNKALTRLPQDSSIIDFALANRILNTAQFSDIPVNLEEIAKRVISEQFDANIAIKSANFKN